MTEHRDSLSNAAIRVNARGRKARRGLLPSLSLREKLLDAQRVRKVFLSVAKTERHPAVTVGTIFEDSHIPINKWLMAIFLVCSSKKAISAHQLHRNLHMTYKAAWFMAHRIRYAMKQGPLAELLKGVVEVDETYVGGKTKGVGRAYKGNKAAVVSLVERGGNKRSMVVDRVTGDTLRAAVNEHVTAGAHIHTDEHAGYKNLGAKFTHRSVNHSVSEYARKESDMTVTTNSEESSFSLLKRGVYGTFHHVSKKHLHRYLAEFDFRWNKRKTSDGERTVFAIGGFVGKRLKYRDSSN